MRRLPVWFVIIFILAASAGSVRGQAPAGEPYRAAGDRPVDIQHLRLELRVDLPHKTADVRATLQIRSLRPIASIPLDAAGFEVKQVMLAADGKPSRPAHFSQEQQKLVIDLEPAWPAGEAATLVVDYRLRDPKEGLYFFGPTAAEPDVPLTAWSHGEPTSNHFWFPCLDHPNQRQTTELVVTVAEGFDVLSNGKLVERRANAGDQTVTFHWRQDKPHVAYLVSLVIGQFDVVREEANGLPVLYYVPKGHQGDVARTFGRTRDMIAFFSKRFGIAYPWDKYAQVVVEQFIAGGQENTSATTLTDWALHDERARLDSSPDGLIAHELAHQWWGDLVTCREWAHIWLNEGFATFSEAVWAEHDLGPDEYAYNMLEKARSAMGGDKDRPIVDHRYPTAMSMFDARAYPKGAWVLHMLRRQLGEETFWKCIQRYGTEHRLRCAETSDLRRTLERETGRSLDRFFYDWTERPGHPVLEVSTEYLADTKLAKVRVKQTQAGEAFHFPLTLAFRCPPASQPVVLQQEITEKEHTFFVPLPGRPALVDVDPEQLLLAEIKETKSRELWLAQLSEAPGVASRVRAAKHLAGSKSAEDAEALAHALRAEKFWGVQAEIAAALGEAGGDTARDALVEGLHHAHPKVRRACAEHLAKFPHDAKAAAALRDLLRNGDASYFVEGSALAAYARLRQPDTAAVLLPWLARASHRDVLRTSVLEGLAEAQDWSALDTLVTWTKRGKPRACRSAALRALGELAKKANPTDDQRRQIVAAVTACLDGESPTVRRSAVSTLRELGQSASPALAALEALALHDPDEGIRDLARKAGDQIRSHAPVPVELTRLREELDRVKRANETLQERLDKFEKAGRK